MYVKETHGTCSIKSITYSCAILMNKIFYWLYRCKQRGFYTKLITPSGINTLPESTESADTLSSHSIEK